MEEQAVRELDVRRDRESEQLSLLRRDLGTIERDLQALYDAGEVSTMNPPKLTEADVATLLLRWRTRPSRYGTPMDPTSQAHLFRALRGLLEWCGNGAISRMNARSHVRFPRTVEKPVEVLCAEDLARIKAAADAISGWNGVVARLVVNLAVASGLRPKELRLARLVDLDLSRGRIRVSHPKGEGAWAAQGYAPILGTAREEVREFLEEGADYLSSRGFDPSKVEPLVPDVRKDVRVETWPEAMLRKLKGELERVSGVRFHLKTFRATFAQLAKDNGASIEAVSRALRHASTKNDRGLLREDSWRGRVSRARDGLGADRPIPP